MALEFGEAYLFCLHKSQSKEKIQRDVGIYNTYVENSLKSASTSFTSAKKANQSEGKKKFRVNCVAYLSATPNEVSRARNELIAFSISGKGSYTSFQ